MYSVIALILEFLECTKQPLSKTMFHPVTGQTVFMLNGEMYCFLHIILLIYLFQLCLTR